MRRAKRLRIAAEVEPFLSSLMLTLVLSHLEQIGTRADPDQMAIVEHRNVLDLFVDHDVERRPSTLSSGDTDTTSATCVVENRLVADAASSPSTSPRVTMPIT